MAVNVIKNAINTHSRFSTGAHNSWRARCTVRWTEKYENTTSHNVTYELLLLVRR